MVGEMSQDSCELVEMGTRGANPFREDFQRSTRRAALGSSAVNWGVFG